MFMSVLYSSCSNDPSGDTADSQQNARLFPVPAIEYQPRQYICRRTISHLEIDGRLDEIAWKNVAWTEFFIDIEGPANTAPRFETRVKMLWDSACFYVAAQMEEPHLWGTLTERDAVIYHDNDFELFIDPDGDSHEYYELEINALGTEWDLLLLKPYRDGGPAVNAWDITGLRTAVALEGTLNDPSDQDTGWSIEIAMPWKVLAECAHRPAPPLDGNIWWVNFSRVQWRLEIKNDRYQKQMDSTGTKPLSEDNWVWSPQGLIAMHYPEMWGLVQFSSVPVGDGIAAFVSPDDLQARWALRLLYYAEREFEAANKTFTSDFGKLIIPELSPDDYRWPPRLHATEKSFVATITNTDGSRSLSIAADGRLTSFARSPEEKK